MPVPARPCLALPFTVVPGRDQVRLVAGEDFRFTLASPGLETWLPDWLPRMDGRLSLDELLALLPAHRHEAARGLLERLASERMLVAGPVELAHPARPHRLVIEGRGALCEAVRGLAADEANAPAVNILCQDRLDLDEAMRFNERCLAAAAPWLWASSAALSRGYVSPVFLADAGPCLACLLSRFRRLSPLPELYDDLLTHARSGGVIQPTPFPTAAIAMLAQLAVWKASEWLARAESPAALYRLHVLEVATLEVTSHPVLIDAECPACRGHR